MKKNIEKQIKEELGITNKRGATFVGFRPTKFRDRSKFDRNRSKAELRKEVI